MPSPVSLLQCDFNCSMEHARAVRLIDPGRCANLRRAAMLYGPCAELRQLVLARIGIADGLAFQYEMKQDHMAGMNYIARLLRVPVKTNGPVKRHELDAWLRRSAVAEFLALLHGS